MKLTTTGLVLKEVKLRESDRILTLLTPQHGILSASARGSLRPNNKLFSACGQFTYSEWTLHAGKTMYSVDEAAPLEVFFGLRQDIEALALAAYITELLQIFSPTGEEGGRLLKLALNSLHLLGEGARTPTLVKAVFELRSLSESGFMPNLLACENCGKYDGGLFWLNTRAGYLQCGNCAAENGHTPNLNEAALAALRYIVLSEEDKVFNFTLAGASLDTLGRVAENYALQHLDYPPKTLSFLKSLMLEA